jgi:hypothetical protein
MKKKTTIFLISAFLFVSPLQAQPCACSVQIDASSVLIVHYEVTGSDCRNFEQLAQGDEGVISRGYIITNTVSGAIIQEADANPSSDCK